MPVRRKNWDLSKGEGLKFTVEYKYKDPQTGEIGPVTLTGWTPKVVFFTESGQELFTVTGLPQVVVVPADGKIGVEVTPDQIALIPGRGRYTVFVTKDSDPDQVVAITKGAVRVTL